MKMRILLLAALLAMVPVGVFAAAKLEPALQAALDSARGDIPVIVRLQAQANTSRALADDPDRRQARAAMIRHLRQVAAESQALLRRYLADQGITRVDSLILANALAFTAAPELIRSLADRPEVASIRLDGSVPAPELPAPVVLPSALLAHQWDNLGAINAPALWNLGYDGAGVVVAILDTGVDVSHLELKDNYLNNGHSWFDPYRNTTVPYDILTNLGSYHGTAVMGVFVGATTGVAPAAKWIAAKIFDDSGVATYSAIHRSFDWVLDPDSDPATDDSPDVVNNSWSLGDGAANQCLTEFATDIQKLHDAGIAVVLAGGNFGNGTDPTSVSPANNLGNLAAGMVDSQLVIDPESSRGPSPCDPQGVVYPDIVAPGVFILAPAGGTLSGYVTITGTSFAAPHVSGVIALLKQAVPLATGPGLERAVTEAARDRDLGASGPDNVYGNGMLDAGNAYSNLQNEAAPTAPAPLAPVDGATGLSAGGVTVSWLSGVDPDGETVRSRVNWGTDPTLANPDQVLLGVAGRLPAARVAGLGLAGLGLLAVWARRRRMLAAALLLAAGTALLSCGGGGGSTPAPPSYTISGLASNTTYYWRVDSIDERGKVTPGPVRRFTTAP